MSLRIQAARGLKWQAIEIGGRQILSLVVFTALARILDPSAFGLVGLVGVYIAFVGMFVDQGIGSALIQRNDLQPGHLDAAFWFNVSCAAMLCLATIALAGPVSRFFNELTLQPLLQWASLSLVINASSAVHQTLFFRAMDFRRPAIRTLVANLFGGGVGVAMALTGWGVWSLIGQQLAASLSGTIFLWIASQWRPQLRFSLARLRELMAVSMSVFSVGFLWFFSSRLDQIVIGRFLGSSVLGQYVIGAKLTDLAKAAIQQPVGAVSLPALSQLQNDHARMRQAIYKGMTLNAVVSFAVFVGLAAVAQDLVPLAFGEQWEMAGTVCALLSLYTLVTVLQVFFHPALLASGGPGGYVALNVLHTAGVAAACFIGMRHGVNVVIIGLIANGICVAVLALLFLRRRMGLSPLQYCRPCLVPLFASVVMLGGVWSARSVLLHVVAAWWCLAAQVAVGAALYVSMVAWLSPSTFSRLTDLARQLVGKDRMSEGPSSPKITSVDLERLCTTVRR